MMNFEENCKKKKVFFISAALRNKLFFLREISNWFYDVLTNQHRVFDTAVD